MQSGKEQDSLQVCFGRYLGIDKCQHLETLLPFGTFVVFCVENRRIISIFTVDSSQHAIMTIQLLLVTGVTDCLWLYVLSLLLFLTVCFLLYQNFLLRKSASADDDYRRFLFDILDNLPFPIMVKDIQENNSSIPTGIKNPSYSRHQPAKMPSASPMSISLVKKGGSSTGR